ncbi:MAG: DUF2161 family putative PD-(D/E)XK-type phosphodiesterase [Candidatus Izemoplasmatales bacterium]
MMEKDMFPLLKDFLMNDGYDVKAEVLKADIVAKKDDIILIVEMKSIFSTTLIYQGLKRQHISDYVYLAIEKPSSKVLNSSTFKEKKTIVRRLELGLILVDIKKEMIEVILDPKTYHFKNNKKKRKELYKEFSLRKTSMNTGGVKGVKIMTAYKELALMILDAMKDGPKTSQYLKNYTTRDKTLSILQKNYYGWFERVSRGVYQLSDAGRLAIDEYQDVIKKINQ